MKKSNESIIQIIDELKNLNTSLEWVMKEKNPLFALVRLYAIASRFHDTGYFGKAAKYVRRNRKLSALRQPLIRIQDIICLLGRDPKGINRTFERQLVTSKDIYLKDLEGMVRKSVMDWITQEELAKKETISDGRTYWDVINQQAELKVHSNVIELLANIENIFEIYEEIIKK